MWEKQKSFMSTYLCEAFVDAVERYQNLVHISIKDNFRDRDLPLCRESAENLKFKPFSMLSGSSNKYTYIEVAALRIIVHRNYTFILASEIVPIYDVNKYLCVIVINPENSDAMTERWHRQIALNMCLLIKQPFLQTQLSHEMQTCLARLQNVTIKEGKRWKDKVEEIKEKGNEAFKQRVFMSALIYYQYALTCCQDFKDSKTRAILYSNSSACLYEMRLYDTSIKYATMAIRIDNTYHKGYIRKILSLMQKKQFNEVPNLLVSLQSLIDAESLSIYNRRYTSYLCNSIGMYNWKDIFQQQKKETYFGEFLSKKIRTKLDGNKYVYYADAPIKKSELLVLNKPIIYYSTSQESSNIYPYFDQIRQYTALQKSFYFAIKNLPCECHPDGGVDNNYEHMIDKQQLKRKIQRSICLERDLEKIQKIQTKKIGVWTQMYTFSHNCQPNCSFVHLRSVMCVSAIKNISKGQLLSLDYAADVDPKKRKELLLSKQGISCKCKICEWKEWPQNFSSGEQIVKVINSLDNVKMIKQTFWQLIKNKQVFEGQLGKNFLFKDVLQKYLELVDKQTCWQDLVNIFRLYRGEKNEKNKMMERILLAKGISQFLKLPIDEGKEFVDLIS